LASSDFFEDDDEEEEELRDELLELVDSFYFFISATISFGSTKLFDGFYVFFNLLRVPDLLEQDSLSVGIFYISSLKVLLPIACLIFFED